MIKKAWVASNAVVILTLFAACAPAATVQGSSQTVITTEELEAVQVNSLYEAVNRLRPRWLTVRSPQTFGSGAGMTAILVYQNQTRLGGVDVLRDLGKESAVWLEYLDRATASATLPGAGGQDVEAAIVIHTTPRR